MGVDDLIHSFGPSFPFIILRLLLTAVWCYVLFMCSLWNSLEKNALKAGCSAMEIHLLGLTKNFDDEVTVPTVEHMDVFMEHPIIRDKNNV